MISPPRSSFGLIPNHCLKYRFSLLPSFGGVGGGEGKTILIGRGNEGTRVRGYDGTRVRGYEGTRVRRYENDGARERRYDGMRARGYENDGARERKKG